ncbi:MULTISPECIES: adenylate/guanylate cyclase domain-containing protein [unclassified Roseateles]|uniref:ATP-binding protein n=1 Tax=unclassified Roseateles TaxID=2626991 RepID=UPI000A6CA636|nr:MULTISPECIES: adenylate/guanylate cyclase domain-containing protein [unclassified Roseateles]
MSTEQQQLQAAIHALQAQRELLGDAVVDASIGALRAKLAAVADAAAPASKAVQPPQALRQVSILFVDVVGSTTLSQQLDPEETSAVMDGFLRRGTATVQAHGGRVVQYAGDSMLAVFGVQEAAEDDAERAVRCGLGLLDLGRALAAEVLATHGLAGCHVRVGIHTGGVLLGGGGGGDGDENAVRGLTVNIAARMEQTAAAGALRISHDTYSHIRGLFEVSSPESLQVKGVDQPITSYLVRKAKPRSFRIAKRGIEGVATRMIGRDAEFEALQAIFKDLFSQPRLRVVLVVAEAGIGKSRLLDEFQAWTEDRPETVYLFRGRATPQTQGQPFGLLRDIVAWRLQLSDEDTLDEAKAKIERGLMPLFADEPEHAQAHAHLLGHLIGLDWKDSAHLRGILDDPNQIRSRALHAAAQMFRRVSGQKGLPVILQLEDLHWADDETLDFLSDLAQVNADMPLLLLAFSRPTLLERRADWLSGGQAHTRIDLHPLGKADSRKLVNELLKKLPEVPDALREVVMGGAEGNPFYMEELVLMLIDQGAIDASGAPWQLRADRLLATKVPSTLTGVLQARLDGLPADERLTLQEASVIGQVFWVRALAALDADNEARLPRLVQRELALPRLDSEPDDLREYAFKHALLHQVTYGTVLKRQRSMLHAKLAHWLAAQSQGDSARAGEFLGLTAKHFADAGDAGNAAEFHARAAEYAADRLAHASALAHVKQALASIDAAGASAHQAALRWRLICVRERTWEIQGERDKQAADIDAMDGIADSLDDDARRAYTACRRATHLRRIAAHADCERAARRAVALADKVLAKWALSLAPAGVNDELHEIRLMSLRWVGHAVMSQGRWDEARLVLQQALSEACERGLPKAQILCLNSLGILAERCDDRVGALGMFRESLAISRQAGDRRNEAIQLGNVGLLSLPLGDLSTAQRDLDESLQMVRQNGDRALECARLCGLSALAVLKGEADRARVHAGNALDTARAVQAREWVAFASFCLADALTAGGQVAAAAAAYAEARTLAEELNSGWRFDAGAGLASLLLAQGDISGAVRALQPLLPPAEQPVDEAVAQGTAMSGGPAAPASAAGSFPGAEWPRKIEFTIHRVLATAGDPRAAEWLQRAHRTLMAQADAIKDVALRQMFLTNIPHHRDIAARWQARGGQ